LDSIAFFPSLLFWSVLSVCQFFFSFFSHASKLPHIFSLITQKTKKKKKTNKMKSKRVFGCSSQEYEEEDLAYDTPERKKKQKGGRSSNKVVHNGTFFVFTSLI
jgi:hypothetical protein